MLNCREVATKASDLIDNTMPWHEKAAMYLHLAMCASCRRFVHLLRQPLPAINDEQKAISPNWINQTESLVQARLTTQDTMPESTLSAFVQRQRQQSQSTNTVDALATPTNPDVIKIFAEIESHLGSGIVPNLFRVYAHHPAILQANWNKVKAVMLDGVLSRRLKETIAVMISRDNSCQYCVHHHSQALIKLGASADELATLTQDPNGFLLDNHERSLLRLAREANRPHHASTTPNAIEAARSAGASDAEIIEALAVMEIFTAFNRFQSILAIPLEQGA